MRPLADKGKCAKSPEQPYRRFFTQIASHPETRSNPVKGPKGIIHSFVMGEGGQSELQAEKSIQVFWEKSKTSKFFN